MTASRRVLATGKAPGTCDGQRSMLAYLPRSRHRGQCKSNEVRLAEFVRLCPRAPAPSCKAAFDFHPASSSHALRSGRVTAQTGTSNTRLFSHREKDSMHEKPFESRMPKGLAAVRVGCKPVSQQTASKAEAKPARSGALAQSSAAPPGKFPKGVVTPPFCAKSDTGCMHAKPFESRMPKALAAFFGALETCFAVIPKVRGAL